MEDSLREFHSKYGHVISIAPTTDLQWRVKLLRETLIKEEFEELVLAIDQDNLVEIADGAADLIYVIVGTCVSYGIPIERVFREVHRSNMTKTAIKAEGGSKYGTKTPKGPDYIPPDIRTILFTKSRTRLEEAAETNCETEE